MSVWSDIQKRSIGEKVRAEDFIRSKEELSNIILEKAQNGSGDLADILKGLSSHIDLPEDEQLFDIEDKHRVLANDQRFLLQVSLILPFKLWDYKSIENILIDQKVRVIIDPNEPEREVPSNLLKEKEFWEKRAHENPNDVFARIMLEKVLEEIRVWASMILLGLYKPGEKVIILYPNNMRKIEGGKRMNELLVSTLVHEAMHAYFDRTPLDHLPYVYYLEEPMAEFGMLLYLNETHLTDYYNWAKIFVSSKKTCYRYGVALMEQCVREGVPSKTRKDLVFYKLSPGIVSYASVIHTTSSKKGGVSRYMINGKGQYSMKQVVEEYIKYKLDAGVPFNIIQSNVHSIPHVGRMFISTKPNRVSIHKGQTPHTFTYKGTDYYITTQLKDNGSNYNFENFRTEISKTDPCFIITII